MPMYADVQMITIDSYLARNHRTLYNIEINVPKQNMHMGLNKDTKTGSIFYIEVVLTMK